MISTSQLLSGKPVKFEGVGTLVPPTLERIFDCAGDTDTTDKYLIYLNILQMNMDTFTPIEKIFVGTIVGPFFEEFLFRVVFFTTIAYIVGFIDNKFNYSISKKVFNLRSMICWTIIIIGNILFSLSHLPNASNFHLYFIGGIVDTIIYINSNEILYP